MLVGVELAGAGDAALDLVEHQHQVVLVAEFATTLDEGLAGRADAALALHRLDKEARGMLVHGGLRGLQIVELDDLEARQQGREAVAELLLIGRSDEHTSAIQSLLRISYAVIG